MNEHYMTFCDHIFIKDKQLIWHLTDIFIDALRDGVGTRTERLT